MHALYMLHSTSDPEDVLEWIWSFLILSGTAVYIIERPVGQPATSHEEFLFRYLNEVNPVIDVALPWTTSHAVEWLMQAGELRLWLQDGWSGQWDALGLDALTREYVKIIAVWA